MIGQNCPKHGSERPGSNKFPLRSSSTPQSCHLGCLLSSYPTKMAPSRQAQQSISGLLSNAVHSPYVCRSCRSNVRLYAPRPRPSNRLWSKPSTATRMSSSAFHTSASTYYATPAPQDYIHPRANKPKKVQEEWEDLEEYQEAESWDGLEVIGHKQKAVEETVSFAP